MNDLRALVDAATPDRVPGFDAVLARRAQRTRRRYAAAAGGSAAVLAVATLAVQLTTDGSGEAPPPPPATVTSDPPTPSPSPDRIHRADLTYTWSDKPSPLVLRLADRDVSLKNWIGCWDGPTGNLDCTEEPPDPVAKLPDAGDPAGIDFWFGVPGWTFEATFTQLGVDCPRAEHIRAVTTGDHWSHLAPAGLAGDYLVDLSGVGPHGGFKGVPTTWSFVWQTPVDGPVDQPNGQVGESELMVHALGFEPTSAAAEVTVTDADGESTTRRLPEAEGDCSLSADDTEFDGDDYRGELFFQGDFVDPSIPALGPRPYSYRVRLTLDGTTYVGTAANDGHVTWTPELPAYTG
jgi:hypothetical protein